MATAGTLYLVSTPIGNLGDITYRGVEVLRASDTILAEDTRRTRILLKHYDIKPGDLRSFHKHNEAKRTDEVRQALTGGGSVALVSDSGTPLISDPGFRLVLAAIDAGAAVVPIPGASAALAAVVGSGLNPQPFTFLGFVPRSGRERRDFIAALSTIPHTSIFFESPNRLVRTLEDLEAELGGGRRVVVARELTKVHEDFLRGTLQEAVAYYRDRTPRGEVVICLSGTPRESGSVTEEAARDLARALARQGATSKEIVRTLRDRWGLERNRAYSLALEAAEEGES